MKAAPMIRNVLQTGWLGLLFLGWNADGGGFEDSSPLEPEAALASMRVPAGFRVELVACEPLVEDPVAFDWGPDGRLWVAEMRDYPNGVTWNKPGDPLNEPGGRIKVLTDTDGDGRYDQSETFLEGLSFPTGVKVWKGGVLVTAAPEIFYAEDTDGDGKADHREVWYSGFARSNQQHRVNGLAWGLDNWLHVANGDGGGVILSQERREEVDIRGFDLRIHPVTKQLELLNGRTQCGRFRDDWGNWFGCNNSNPLWHYPYPWDLLKRNPEVNVPRAFVDVPVEPGAAPVFPASPTLERFNDFDRANRFTSACGPTIYRDVLLGEAFPGNAFTCEPVHNLVSRQVLHAKGATFTSERHPDELSSEFFASADPWSRPVSARTGPDGALWVADMYRLVIEHPEWIPQAWQKKLELRAGSDRGRIYRVVPDETTSPEVPKLDGLDDAGLVAQLESSNGTVRDLVHQILLWREAKGAVPGLKTLVRDGGNPLARLHALCVLDGLGELDDATLSVAISDSHPGVVRHALRLARGRQPVSAWVAVADAMRDDAFVAVELSGLLGGGDPAFEATELIDLIGRHQDDPQCLPLLLSAVTRENLRPLVAGMTGSDPVESSTSVLAELGRMAAKWKAEDALEKLAAFVANGSEPGQSRRLALLSGLLEGGASLKSLGGDPAVQAKLFDEVELIREQVGDSTLSDDLRVAAVRFIGLPSVFQTETDLSLLAGLLTAQSSPALREAAIASLARSRDGGVGRAVIERWRNLPPSDRSKVLALMLGSETSIPMLLDAVESGLLPANEIDVASRSRLLELKDESLRARAAALFESSSNATREEVILGHADVLSMKGDAATGKTVFAMVCVACHVVGNVGNPVGPDLAALTDRSPGSLLTAILDPNRSIEDKFLNYTVTLTNGDSVFGLIADENANGLTIRQADGSARAVSRSEIKGMASNGISLMPEGFERVLTKQQLSDLLAYLGGLGSTAPATPKGNIDMAARISPGKDGIVELKGSRCRLDGEKIVYLPETDAIGWWTSDEDRAQWTLVLDRPRRYRVEWDYSVAPEAAGNGWQIEIGGKVMLSGIVASTGSWETFKTETLGTVDLPAADNHVVVRSKGQVKGALLDLRRIRFFPVDP